jgi:putative ABC transport system permease protein
MNVRRWVNSQDRGEKVVVLAHDAAKRLFPFEDPIGKSVWAGNEFYVVVGQTAPRTASAAVGGSLDERR